MAVVSAGGLARLGLACSAVLASASLAAGEPLYIKDLGPLSGTLGLPAQRDAVLAAPGQWQFALHTALASHYVSQERGNELLNFDGETFRAAIDMRYGFAPDWEVQLEVPWLRHSGGHLDGFLDDWHDLINTTDGGRSEVPKDLLVYGYRDGDSFLLRDERSGFGDPSLSVSYQLRRTPAYSASLALGYKLGSGDADQFLGSGSDDAWVGLRASYGDDTSLRWSGQFGYLRAGRSDLVPTIGERNLWFAGLGFDWQVFQRWSLLAQLDAHAAPANSAIKGLGEDTVIGSAGLRWQVAHDWALELAIAEDLNPETAPDVTFFASLRYRATR